MRFPNGRWGDRTSPAYGELSEYYLAFKRPKVQRAKLWGTPQTEEDVWNVFVRFIDGQVKQLPWCEQALSLESAAISENLQWLNSNGFLTIGSQPRVNESFVEFFVAPEKMAHLVKVMRRDFPQLSFHALNRRGDEHRNTPLHTWKDEAFEVVADPVLASAYPEGSRSHEVVQHIYDTYFLVNIVDNDHANDKSDIFSIFTRIITEAMDKEQLCARVLEMATRREKMFETLVSFQTLLDEQNGELRAAHSELRSVRSENLR
ncbi:unnamed protein product [Peronospora destructor]|uniref:MTHFR SAM-binding regulatory domain-containing protein n=1 Tax=Peronospora destructor TaxID=86335 RepID=A0AAV0U5N3_9STRA|nr:unnamed protein product [Peronospora destructor]